MIADRAWNNGGSDLARLVFEVLDERADLLAALAKIRSTTQPTDFEWEIADRAIAAAHQGEGT